MSNITSYYMERAERLRWQGVGKPQLHAPRLTPRTKAMVAVAASLARAKENPNALPDRIELLLDDNYATRMASVSPRPSPNPNPSPSPGPSPSSSASASASPSPNSNPGQLCGRSALDDVPPAAAATGRQPLGDSFGLDGRVGAPLFRLSTRCPPAHLQASRHLWSPSRPTIAPHHLPPRARPRLQPRVSVDPWCRSLC